MMQREQENQGPFNAVSGTSLKGRVESLIFGQDQLPGGARIYLLSVIIVGFVLFTHALVEVLSRSDLHWVSLIFLTLIASHFTVTLPLSRRRAQSVSITMADVFVFSAILLFGPAVAVMTAAVEGLIMNFRASVTKRYKQFFNIAQLVVVSWVVAYIFYQLHGAPPPVIPGRIVEPTRFLVQAGLCGLIYFGLNTGIIAFAVSLSTRQAVFQTWKDNFVWAWITHLAGASLAAITFLWFEENTLYSLIVAIPVVLLTYYAYRLNLNRIRQTQEHLEQVEGLLAEKIEAEKALQKAKEELEIRVMERTAELREANRQLLIEVKDRIAAEKELASEKERLAVTLRSIADGVITTDTRGRVLLVNAAAEELTGWTQGEASGRPLSQVFHIVHQDTGKVVDDFSEQVLGSGEILNQEGKDLQIITRDGTRKSIALSSAPIRDRDGRVVGVAVVFRDITYQKRMEEELFKAQKLESIGVLAGGIAHDFNNILSGILLKAQLARMAAKKGREPLSFLESIEEATNRATALTQQLLTFAKGGTPIKKTASISELLRESASFALRGSNVRCEFEIDPDLWAVEIDAGQMSQVINNLVINAEQAMPGGGTILLQADNLEITEEEPVAELLPGRYVRVRVKDEGVGIPPEAIKRVFDPYFTTKPKGHGLGLASTYSIIHRHGGAITVESEVNRGTTFSFYLPASLVVVPEDPETVDETVIRGSGRILVMDDEEIIRDCTVELLQELGYEVTAASDGLEAIEHYTRAMEEGDPFDALIVDLTIPGGMGGKEAIERLRKIDPQICAVVSSGYSEDPVMANYQKYGFSAVLTKPFTLVELGKTLESLLAGRRADPVASTGALLPQS
ncbi:MAG TPA: ATP-binding protein [Acidobacteriota bacterium]|nr:ATP-binding protein [Acidobacteriota bacterium]